MSTKRKIYLYLIAFTGIFLLFLLLIIPRFLEKIRKDSEDFLSLKRESVALQQENENLRQLEVVYQSHQREIARIDDILVDPELPVGFLDLLEKNAQDSQQEIEISLSPPKKTEEKKWSVLFSQVSTSGSFPNFLKFLGKLENSPYLIQIINLDLKKSTEPNVKSSLLMRVFAKND